MAQNGIKKIAVLGAESTGKSWLCEALARHYKTVWVPEYARAYFNDSDIYNYTQNDLVVIAKEQIRHEQELAQKASRFLFCDTTLITLKIWAELEFKNTPAFIAEQLPLITYDHYFVMDNQVPWQADEQRLNKFSRNMLLDLNLAEVKQTNTSYSLITGMHEERLQQAIEALERLF